MNPTKRKKLAKLRRLRESQEENQPAVVEEAAPEPVAGLRYPEPTSEPEAKPAAKKAPAAKKKSVVKKITEMLDKE